MKITTASLLPTAAIFWAASTTLPSLIEGAPGPKPPEGQVLAAVSPLYVAPEGTPPADGGTPPQEEEEWPVDDSRAAPDMGITPNHIGCRFVLETEQSCYDWSGKGYIKVRLENCDPKAEDWIAIYESSDNEIGRDKGYSYWGYSFDWQFTCGTRSCSYPIRYNYNYFEQWWHKVPDGEYQIFLFADDGYRVKAASRPFVVRNEYGYCDGCATSVSSTEHPTYYPTPAPTDEPACSDSDDEFRTKKYGWKDCDWVKKKTKKRCKCKLKGRGKKKAKDECPKSCDNCPVVPTQSPTVPPTPNPTASPTRNPTPAPTARPTEGPTTTQQPTDTFKPTTTFSPTTFFPTTFLPTT